MVDDWTGQQMGKKGDKKEKIKQAVFFNKATINIDKVGYLGKGEKTYSKRQNNI